MSYEKMEINRKVFDDILNELNILKLTTTDGNSRIIVDKILDMMQSCREESTLESLKEKIAKKMSEYKYKNPEASTSLYILLRKLEDGKISKEEAMNILQKFVVGEVLERRMY